jgi:hypothetical protein
MRRDGQVVDPPSVALITGHAGGDNMVAKDAHQEPFRVNLEFPSDVPFWIVLRDDQVALQPQFNDSFLILQLVSPDHQVIHDSSPLQLFFSVSLIAGSQKKFRYKGAS